MSYVNKPDIPTSKPEAPPNPSPTYISGYHDGFNGDWVAPLQWALVPEYRAGWQAGAYDRNHNLPNQYS